MGTFGVILICLLNVAISCWNAWSCGKAYPESKQAGGWSLVVVWSGLIMAACGFTTAYLVVLGFLAGAFHFLSPQYVQVMMEFGYLMIIFPILGSGFAITVHSWLMFAREKNFMNFGVGAYNTYATISNTISAVQFVPGAFRDIASKLTDTDDDDPKGKFVMLAIALAIVSVLLGILTTRAIFYKAAGKKSQSLMSGINLQKQPMHQ